ncbi:restriction endonuclease subunit S [Staphylococcus capitis]|uniref:restriction endonuclease subunit S n=1 Tax=Staphylococcus capitis TaxID=29388 RepID=UPI000BFDEDFE|nr:restriction endonuclease subunit S [Staphylococcus capitis]ATN01736.1 restriction endonuclease subunit S [Staphylococcus capitis]
MTEQNTPELRFPVINDPWESSTLNQITSILKDGTHGTHKDSKEGPWLLSAKNLKNNKISINEDDRKISKVDFDRIYKNYNLKRGDLLLSIVGTIGNVAIVKDPENIAFQRSVAILRMRNEFYNKFFLNLFQTHSFKKKLKRNQVVSAQPGIYLGDLGKLQIKFPLNLKEQKKIGEFFSKLDRQIELEEEKLELLEQQKKGYMQKIFSQELRFKDADGNEYQNWEQCTIAEVTNYSSSKKSSNQYEESETIQGYPVYDAIQEIGKDFQYDMEQPYISILKDGAGVGRLNLRQGQSSVIGTMSYLLPNNIDIKFLYYRMKLLNFRKYIIGSTIPHLYYKDYSKEKIFLPSILEEQEKIGQFIFKMDKLIDDKSKKLELLKQRKQGLLQKMFV